MLLTALFAGCGEDVAVSEKPAESVKKGGIVDIQERMRDPEYVKSLDENVATRKDIMRRLSAARAQLASAKSAGEPAEKIAELEKAVVDLMAEYEANRGKAQSLVREKMLSRETSAQPKQLTK